MKKRIPVLTLALALVLSVVLVAQAAYTVIEKVNFTSEPKYYYKDGTTLTANSVSVAASEQYTVVDVRVVSELGSDMAMGTVVLRPKTGYGFKPDTAAGNYIIQGTSLNIGTWSSLKESELPDNIIDRGAVLSADGAKTVNNVFAGGQNIAREGDLMIPFILQKGELPATGDAENIALLVALFGIGAAGLCVLGRKRRTQV